MTTIEKRKLKFFGHETRAVLIQRNVEGIRGRGRPKRDLFWV